MAKEPLVLQISLISGLHRKLNSRLRLLIKRMGISVALEGVSASATRNLRDAEHFF